ncbi:MAG: segregation/condensation protein A, partial [Phycisphaerales bacterium]
MASHAPAVPPPPDYSVRLSSFQGPLDLLLYLIRRAEVDIHDIPIAEVTDQYLAFVKRDVAHVDMDEAGEFLVMAATLIEIKARTLAPKKPAGEGGEGADGEAGASREPVDPRTELVQALLAYQRYRRAAEELERHRGEFWRRHAIRIAGHRLDRPGLDGDATANLDPSRIGSPDPGSSDDGATAPETI